MPTNGSHRPPGPRPEFDSPVPGKPGTGLVGVSGRAAVILPVVPGGDAARSGQSKLEEACGLAEAIDLDVVLAEQFRLNRPRPATLIGQGTVERLKARIEDDDVAVVIVDTELSPVQQRNLELAWKCKVIDRTGLILEIFGERAQTREGSLQVELAALTYQRSRLVRSWTHLERQRGGFGFLGGPGETQIEADRRQIDTRIVRIKQDLNDVKRTRALHRRARSRVPFPVVALVGYTNAGKSTLFNRLTQADVYVENLLFATLDPTIRAVELPSGRKIILSDTVGFVSDLPTQLVAAFRATLEEVLSADIVIHVRDIAHPDTEAQRADVEEVLHEIGLDIARTGVEDESVNGEGSGKNYAHTSRFREGAVRFVEALNKIDLLSEQVKAEVLTRADRDPDTVALSAATGEGIESLHAMLDAHLTQRRRVFRYDLGPAEGADISWLYDHGEVIAREDDEAGTAHLTIALDPEDAARFETRRHK